MTLPLQIYGYGMLVYLDLQVVRARMESDPIKKMESDPIRKMESDPMWKTWLRTPASETLDGW